MERAEMDLQSFLENCKSHPQDLPWSQRMAITLQIARAVGFLHQKHIIRRDLKGKNIVIHYQKQKDQWVAALTDFGIARVIKTQAIGMTKNEFGTVPWTAPEALDSDEG